MKVYTTYSSKVHVWIDIILRDSWSSLTIIRVCTVQCARPKSGNFDNYTNMAMVIENNKE